MKKTKNMIYTPTEEARELALYAENNGELWEAATSPALDLLAKKYAKGDYSPEKAISLYYDIACKASKLYTRDFGYGFTVSDRYTAAVDIEDFFREIVIERAKKLTKTKTTKTA